MKVVLFMASSVNGAIAERNGGTTFVTPADKKRFVKMALKEGNAVMGMKTFETVKYDSWVEKISVVVLTKRQRKPFGSVSFARSPNEALRMLDTRGFDVALLAGGGKVNASFLKEGLIDEIYLDVEPSIIGDGIPIFACTAGNAELRLKDIHKLSKNEVRLHYAVTSRKRHGK